LRSRAAGFECRCRRASPRDLRILFAVSRDDDLDHRERQRQLRQGFALATAAYLIYGIMPIYMKLLKAVPTGQIMAHRVVWSALLLAGIVSFSRRWPVIGEALAQPRLVGPLVIAAAMIFANWLLYIWAVLHNFVLETSLGFFITPLITVLLGVVALRERLRPLQGIAVAIAAIGVAVLAFCQGQTLWIALVLAGTVSTAGLIRKIMPLDPLCGLLIETSLMVPFAIAWLLWGAIRGQPLFGADIGDNLLLVMTGVVTAVPLLLFSAAAKKMPYSLAGQFQYIGPTLQFLQAVLLFHEPFGSLHLFTFICIWSGLGLVAFDMLRPGFKWWSTRGAVACPRE